MTSQLISVKFQQLLRQLIVLLLLYIFYVTICRFRLAKCVIVTIDILIPITFFSVNKIIHRRPFPFTYICIIASIKRTIIITFIAERIIHREYSIFHYANILSVVENSFILKRLYLDEIIIQLSKTSCSFFKLIKKKLLLSV